MKQGRMPSETVAHDLRFATQSGPPPATRLPRMTCPQNGEDAGQLGLTAKVVTALRAVFGQCQDLRPTFGHENRVLELR